MHSNTPCSGAPEPCLLRESAKGDSLQNWLCWPTQLELIWELLPLRPTVWAKMGQSSRKPERVYCNELLLLFRAGYMKAIFGARHNPEPRSEVWWWNLRRSLGGKCFWRFSPAKEARKSPSKLRRKFATNFAENFANFTLEIAGAYNFLCAWNQQAKQSLSKRFVLSVTNRHGHKARAAVCTKTVQFSQQNRVPAPRQTRVNSRDSFSAFGWVFQPRPTSEAPDPQNHGHALKRTDSVSEQNKGAPLWPPASHPCSLATNLWDICTHRWSFQRHASSIISLTCGAPQVHGIQWANMISKDLYRIRPWQPIPP